MSAPEYDDPIGGTDDAAPFGDTEADRALLATATGSAVPLLAGYDLVIGIDSEYVKGSHLDLIPRQPPKKPSPSALKKLSPAARDRALAKYRTDRAEFDSNVVLCYSYAALDPRSGRIITGVIYPSGDRRDQRSYLGGFLGIVIGEAERAGMLTKPAKKSKLKQDNLSLAMVAHFSRADLSAFRDWPRLKSCFDVVRGTYVTLIYPAPVKVWLGKRNRRRSASVYLFDTKLLAPAGKGRLEDLGDLLSLPKLKVPDVTTPAGQVVRGIERMDLVLAQHRALFEEYAIRDSLVAVRWLERFAVDVKAKGVAKMPKTIAGFGVSLVFEVSGPHLPDTMGRDLKRGGRLGDFTTGALSIQSIAADAYHGGRNEAYVHGIFTASDLARPFVDFDLKGAYTSALAFVRPIDWSNIERTNDLDRLAVLDVPSFATVKFEFPAGTRFPSLPVDAGDYGLVYPLSGITTVIGPELVVARSQGATLQVITGVRLTWADPTGVRPFVAVAQDVNRDRAKHPKGAAGELLAKERGNSVYGKVAQGVSAMKTTPRAGFLFDSRTGRSKPLPISAITTPWLAAYTSGVPRALLSEILAHLPTHVTVLSATTDGWLSDATLQEAEDAASGPVGKLFASLRVLVDTNQSPKFIEAKHKAIKVLVPKTRGGFTLALPADETKFICARAGHRFSDAHPSPAAENAAWLKVFIDRDQTTTLPRKPFISPRDQWWRDADLSAFEHDVRVNFDYDLKREPVDPVAGEHGTIRFGTRPWPDIDAFTACRRDYQRWRKRTKSILKTLADWQRFGVWRKSPKTGSAGRRTPFQQTLVVLWAKGKCGFPVRSDRARTAVDPTLAEVANILTTAGVPGVTRNTLAHARRGPDPNSLTADQITDIDQETITRLAALAPPETIVAIHALVGEISTPEVRDKKSVVRSCAIAISEGSDTLEIVATQQVAIRSTASANLMCESDKGGRAFRTSNPLPDDFHPHTSGLYPPGIPPAASKGSGMAATDANLAGTPTCSGTVAPTGLGVDAEATGLSAAAAHDLEAGAATAALDIASATMAVAASTAAPDMATATTTDAGSPVLEGRLGLDDLAQLRRVQDRLAGDYGIGRTSLDLARKKAAKFPGTTRERRVIALAIAVQIKLGSDFAAAIGTVNRLLTEALAA